MSTRYFLALNGVKGDSLNSTYKGWFEVSGFDFDLGNTSSIGSATGGAGAGKLTFSPLTLTLDSNKPWMFQNSRIVAASTAAAPSSDGGPRQSR